LNLEYNTMLIIAGVIAALIILILLLRPRKQRPQLEKRSDGEGPYIASKERPYMRPPEPQPLQRADDGPQGNSVPDEIATAATEVAGEMLGTGARAELPGATATPDDLTLLKGVGNKLAARLNELGFARYEQLASLGDTEAAMLEEKLGPFRGRLARDRVVEQARFLARGDRDGFEAQFGSLGGGTAGTAGGAGDGNGMPTIRG
jgi:predicted flap endonuclease-1-like 5' DNA nuclease